MSDTFDVFLSYYWRGHTLVASLVRRLREADLHVFLDRWYPVLGTNWLSALETWLRGCERADAGPQASAMQFAYSAKHQTSEFGERA